LPPTSDWCPRTMLVCANGDENKIRFKFALTNTSVRRDGFEISGQLIPDARSGNAEGAFTKFESG